VRQSLRLAALLLSLSAVPLSAQAPATFDPTRLAKHVQTLSADSFEGRAPATAGERKTVAYLISQFRAAGLAPGGSIVRGRRTWTQAVPLRRSELAGIPRFNLRIGNSTANLAQGEEIAVRAPMNGQTTVRLSDVPLVFAGYGVSAPERGWDDFKGVDVRGKLIVVLINDPDFETGQGPFGGRAMSYYGRWTYKYEEAARRGAAGVLIVHEAAPASYGWATVKNSNTNAMFDIVRQKPAQAHTPFESWIQRDLAVRLFQASGLSFDQAKRAAQQKNFRPIPLNASLSASLSARTERITTYNVVGRLPGKRFPAESVIYTAHHDHLGIGQPDGNGDRIYNGAVDNGSGLAHLIEQARAFARQPRTARSLVFMALAAEEKGLLGSEYYTAHPLYPLAKTVGVVNTDSLGVYGPARNFTIAGTARLGLLDALVEEGRTKGRAYTPDPHPETGGFYRSDHFPFAKAGVPAISFKSGNDLVDGGTQKGEALIAAYTRDRYHQPGDEWSEDWDLTGIARDAQLLHALGRRLANSREWPNWSKDSEFRAQRDKSAGQRR
jgi:Zn-dependent M28 family amino/carboxypeptidase